MAEQKRPLMQQGDEPEFGYFAKRKDRFDAELEAGFKGKKPAKPKKAKKGKR